MFISFAQEALQQLHKAKFPLAIIEPILFISMASREQHVCWLGQDN